MITIETIKSTVPAVNIKSIILEGSSSSASGSKLKAKVKATAITTANEFGFEESPETAFLSVPELNFNDHLGIAIIQSKDSTLTSIISGFGTKILKYIGPTNGWRGTQEFDRILNTELGDKSKDISSLKSQLMSVQTKKLFGDVRSPILEKVDNDGKTIKTVPFEFDYDIEEYTPEHLTYFVLSYLDIQGILSELNTQSFSLDDESSSLGIGEKDTLSLVGFSSPVKNDIVFESGRISNETFFYQLPNGNFWTGQVVNDGGANLKTDTGIPLTVLKTSNIKIQDFRTRKGIENTGVMDDFRGEKKKLEQIISGLKPRLRDVDPNNARKASYVSDLFLSTGPRKSAKIMFMLNFEDLVFKNSVYGELWKTNYGNIKGEVLRRSRIRTIKVFRQQVERAVGTNSIGSPTDKYVPVENSLPQLVVTSGQKSGSSSISSVPNFSENTDIVFSNSDHIRAFSITDENIPSSSNSMYQYYVEIDTVDGSKDFLRDLVKSLRQFSYALKNYLSDVVSSSLRGEQAVSEDPHITDEIINFSRKDGYDPRYNNLTYEFAKKMNDKYGEDMAEGIVTLVRTLELFSDTGSFPTEDTPQLFSDGAPTTRFQTVVGQQIQKFLEIVLDANRATPESIMAVSQDVENITSKIYSFVGEDLGTLDPTSGNSENVSRGSGKSSKNIITVEKHFDEILDVSKQGNGAYDYLSQDSDSVVRKDQGTGLRVVSGQEFRKRTDLETLKYFTNVEPVITAGVTAGKSATDSGAKIPTRNVSMSYLSPAQVVVGDVRNSDNVVDFLNETNPQIATVVESKLVSNSFSSKKTGMAMEGQETFSKTKSSTKNNSGTFVGERTAANSFENFYLSQERNLLPNNVETPDVQSDRTLPSVKETSAPEDGEFIYEGKKSNSLSDGNKVIEQNLDNSKNLPASLFQSLFQKNAGNNRTKVRSEMFDMSNPNNFLATKSQQEISLLPNQIKAFFQSNTANQSDVRLRNLAKVDMTSNYQYSSLVSFNYKSLVSVEYLSGFGSEAEDNPAGDPLSSPRWKILDDATFSSFVGKSILCRLTEYRMPNSQDMGFLPPKEISVEVYDKYFILKPDIATTTPIVAETRPPRFEISPPSFGKGKFDDVSEFGQARKPTKKGNNKNSVTIDSVGKLRQFSKSIKENRIMDAFHSVPGTNRPSMSSPGKPSRNGNPNKNNVLLADKEKTLQEISKLNKKLGDVNKEIKSKEKEKAALAVSLGSQKVDKLGTAEQEKLQEATLKFNRVSQEIESLKRVPDNISVDKKVLEEKVKEIDRTMSASTVSATKETVSVENPDSADQTGSPDIAYRSTEELVYGYEALLNVIETEAESGVVRKENLDNLEKYSGYLDMPETSVKEFTKEIQSIAVASGEASGDSRDVFQNTEELERKEVVVKTSPERTTTSGRRR